MARQKPGHADKRRGVWGSLGRLLKGPVDAFNPRQVAEGARTIGRLAKIVRSGPQPDPRICVNQDNSLDLPAIAFLDGTSEMEIRKQLANRRKQSTIATYCYLAGGTGFLVIWLYEALLQPGYASVAYILGLIGVCTVFFLSAFYHALINWQARTQRLGTAREFLVTEDSWWPS